jgi:hypothetical protein
MTQQAISFPRLVATSFAPGEQVFVNYSGYNGWWMLGEVVKRGRVQVLVKISQPDCEAPRWCYPHMMCKAANVPADWHAAWLSHTGDIAELMKERSRRARRK